MKKHGVNSSITVCPICGKEIGIALLGKLKGDEEAPRKIIALNIPVKGYMTLMKENEFDKVFKH